MDKPQAEEHPDPAETSGGCQAAGAGNRPELHMKNKVVLFYPTYGGPPLGAPLCLLSLASPLLGAGFRVSLIDGAITPDFEEVILREVSDALCFGVSLLTGPMIRTAIRICRRLKQTHPDLPVLFGGWHPSLIPGQSLQPEFVDAIVRGQGELTLVEIAQRLAEGKGFQGVGGVSHKQGGAMVHEPERPVENINNLPAPAYHLVDFDAYAKVRGKREMGYATSVGCPYACNYCTDQVFYKRRFNAYRADRVVSEVTELVERYHLSEVAFLDSNFPVDVKRALAIARGFLDQRVEFGWTVQASTDLLCRMMSEIARQCSNISFSPNIFTPYPGIPIWPQLKAMGVHEPESLGQWSELPLGKNVLPWLQGEELRR